MSDTVQPLLFRAIKGSAKRGQEPVALAFFVDSTEPVLVSTRRLSWSPLMVVRLHEVARAAVETGRPEGKSLPYASLRAALQVKLPEAVMLAHDLGRPWAKQEPGGSFLDVADTAEDPSVAAATVLRTWISMVLRLWAEKLDLDEDLIDALHDAANPGDAFVVETYLKDLGKALREGEEFRYLRHPILQEISRRLEGQELFPSLGPVYRLIRGRANSNVIQFQTWPKMTASGGRYSMVASISVESVPYLGTPVVTVKASRRLWLEAVPEPRKLRRQRGMTGYLMGRPGAPIAVEFSTRVDNGVPQDPMSPEFMIRALDIRADLAATMPEMVARHDGRVFLGVPYTAARDGSHTLGAGASTRDQVDLFDEAAKHLEAAGFRPVTFRETKDTKKAPKRALDFHKALEAEALIADFALSLGRNELGPEDLIDACRELLEGVEAPAIDPDDALKARRKLEDLRAANRGRIIRVHGAARPNIVLIARRSKERQLMRAAITGMFGNAVELVERELPARVHGARQMLPQPEAKARERFQARIEAWGDLAADLSASYGGCQVLVQAADWYDGQKDDPVNKRAGRHALATRGQANVQYLLPPGNGWRGMERYLNRIQAAVYDLMFGHSGLVSEVRSLLEADFPNSATRPKAIIGISLVTQARLRDGASGGQICLATRVDAENGETRARLGWFERGMRWTADWEPFFEAMRRVAGLEAATIGDTDEVRRRSFQAFVAEVVGDAVEQGDRPLVMLDSTSAAGFWPWLTDRAMGGAIHIGAEAIDVTERWRGARLVRIRAHRAGRVLERKRVRYERVDPVSGGVAEMVERYCPTATARTIAIADEADGRGRHYWVTGGYFQMAVPRGLSVYRELEAFIPVSKVRGLELPKGLDTKRLLARTEIDISAAPYRVPNAIDVTVASCLEDDEPDRIAHLVASLRCGYGHTKDATTLPAPLSFEAKARDYMARFTVDDADPEEEDASPEQVEAVDDYTPPEGSDEVDIEDMDPAAKTSGKDLAEEVADEIPVTRAADVRPEPSGIARITAPVLAPQLPRRPAGLTLVGGWERLLRSQIAVHELDAITSNGEPTGLPFRIPAAETQTSVLSLLLNQTANITRPAQAAPDPERTTEMPKSSTAIELLWANAPKKPVLPLPDFVTRDWIAQKAPLHSSFIGKIHKWRGELRQLSGYPWPKAKPTSDEFVDIILDGLRYPMFLPALTRVAVRDEKGAKRETHGTFGIFPFIKNDYRRFDTSPRPPKPTHPRMRLNTTSKPTSIVTVTERIEAMEKAGQYDTARAFAYIVSLTWNDRVDLYEHIRAMPEHYTTLNPVIDELTRCREGVDFQWVRDVVKQPNAPSFPAQCDEDEVTTVVGPDAQVSAGADHSAAAVDASAPPEMGEPDEAEWTPIASAQDVAEEAVSTEQQTGAPETSSFAAAGAKTCPAESALADGMAEASSDWQRTMASLAEMAAKARGGSPNPATVEALRAAIIQAEIAFQRWEAAKPKRVDVASLVTDALSLLAATKELIESCGEEMEAFSDMDSRERLVEQAVAEQAGAALGEASNLLALARTLVGEADAILESKDRRKRLAEATELQERGINAAKAGGSVVLRALSMLEDAERGIDVAGVQASSDSSLAEQRQVSAYKFQAGPEDGPDAPPPGDSALPPAVAKPENDPNEPPTLIGQPHEIRHTAEVSAIESGASVEEISASTAGDLDPAETAEEAQADADLDPAFELVEVELIAEKEPAGDPLDVTQFVEVASREEAVLRDPLAKRIDLRLTELVTAGEFGLAYHLLRTTSRVMPDEIFPFSEAEMRLAAIAGRVSHAAAQGVAWLDGLVDGAVKAIGTIESRSVGEDIACARRIILSASCTEFALFHPALPAMQGFDAIAETTADLGEGFHRLRLALADAARLGFVTPTLLRSVLKEAEGDLYCVECQGAVVTAIEAFSNLNFSYALATKIRQALTYKDGAIGSFRDLFEKSAEAVAAAKSFFEDYGDRASIIHLINRTESAINTKFKGLDGGELERMVSGVSSIAARCAEFVDAANSAPSARNSGHKAQIMRLVEALSAGLDKAEGALSQFRRDASPLLVAAADFASGALARLRDATEGRLATNGLHDHLLAVHGPLLWLPGLHFGRSWLPSPYQPEQIVDTVLSCPLPSIPPSESRAAAFEAAVKARMKEDSFVAAAVLIEAAPYFGIGDGLRATLSSELASNTNIRAGALRDEIDTARRMVDRIQRMRGLVSMDDAQALFALIERIQPDELPVSVSIEARTEEEEGEHILDFCSAQHALEDAGDRVGALLKKPQQEMLDRVASLVADGRASEQSAERVRGMIAEADLPTAGEWIQFLVDGRPIPENRSPNPRLQAFFPHVPDALEKAGKNAFDDAEAALRDGANIGPLHFSHVLEERRQDALEILSGWRNLRRAVEGGQTATNVISLCHYLLDKAGFNAELVRDDASLTNARRKMYTTEMRLRVPTGPESVLLPDFGSGTGWNYRVCLLSKRPTEAELTEICKDAGTFGVMVLVTARINALGRSQLAAACIEHKRRVLVVDEAMLLYALSEREFRPLTLLELAQAFAYATPYDDHGNNAVPREMFFGRAEALRKLEDRNGSRIAYGGRRLGKTALLRHIKAERHDPNGTGTAVGYVDLRSAAIPSKLWEVASRELNGVFKTPVSTYHEFQATARAWLDADARRRILLLLDEADKFIEAEAKGEFTEFLRIQELMNTTNRRFKFVLAGLHNVTRLAHTENSPLKHIAADPQRIGPLMDEDLKEAELLIRRPLAAMGYEFEHHEDVWRILSHCNYYPVLVQTFCAKLLEALHQEVARRKRPVPLITNRHVRDALENGDIRKEIGDKFDATCQIDQRYLLIACVIADRMLRDDAAGRVDEGMSAVAVLDQVCQYWREAFDRTNRLAVVEDLLDEMEGMGLLRQTSGGQWTLRSHAILRLLGNDETIEQRLLEFIDRPAPRVFDPRSMRRPLQLPAFMKVPDGYPCPLTLGQEHDLLNLDRADRPLIDLVFGSPSSDIGMVASALQNAEPIASDGSRLEVTARSFSSVSDLLDLLRQTRDSRPRIVVVDARTEWDPSWIEQALRHRTIRDGRAKLIVVGGPQQALRWVRDPRFLALPPQVRVMPLMPWADAFVHDELDRHSLVLERFHDELRRITGGFNRPMAAVFRNAPSVPERFSSRVVSVADKLLKDRGLLTDLGLSAPLDQVFSHMVTWADGGSIRLDEIADGVLAEVPEASALTAQNVADYGLLMGLLEAMPRTPGKPDGSKSFLLSPLVSAALRAAKPMEVA